MEGKIIERADKDVMWKKLKIAHKRTDASDTPALPSLDLVKGPFHFKSIFEKQVKTCTDTSSSGVSKKKLSQQWSSSRSCCKPGMYSNNVLVTSALPLN